MNSGISMKTIIATVALLSTLPTLARAAENETWADNARFFVGTRASVAVPPGGDGLARIGGLELGVSAKNGVGFGLHLVGMQNPPTPFGPSNIGWGFGAAADIRGYFQTVDPLTLYPTFSLGFLAGYDDANHRNVVMPMVNPGFGARLKFDSVYVALEIGAASFFIPFVALSFGFEPEPARAHRHDRPAISQSEARVRSAGPEQAQFEQNVSAREGEEHSASDR
jgi:hypothetical protein